MTVPVRLLLSPQAAERWAAELAAAFGETPHVLVHDGDADIAFVSRDVTGLSTKHEVMSATQSFYDRLREASSLRWVHLHSAGSDRPIFGELRARGVRVTTSSGANAQVVAHSALAGILALARHLPRLMRAQHERRWEFLMAGDLPRDIGGQMVLLVGWGPVARALADSLRQLGMRIAVARHGSEPAEGAFATVRYEQLRELLPKADWLVLACPLSDGTRGLVGAQELALLPRTARLVNVARGEVVRQDALIEALRAGRFAGAFLDVFEHEPLPDDSPLWSLDGVIVTPHCAGFSDGNEARVGRMFLDNLGRWLAREPLLNLSA